MSKIYEALQQAEHDRKAAEISGLGATSLRKETTPLAAAEVPAPHVASAAQAAVPAAPPLLDPASFRASIWKPRLAQLPAIGERGGAVEQFRNLRSRLYELRDQQPLKSILISSGLPKEGKSYVAANLAISLGRNKASRVLLIDGDMRRSSLHHVLGCESEPGLTSFLSGKASVLEILQRPLPETEGKPLPQGLGSLTVIAGGNESDKAADLSGNRRFEALLAAVAPSFDWIIVDSSPVTLVSDAVNLSRGCDGVLLIVRGGVTRFQTAQRALNELRASTMLGIVLNAVHNLDSQGSYYGYDSLDTTKE